jgi:hypothetical protein
MSDVDDWRGIGQWRAPTLPDVRRILPGGDSVADNYPYEPRK